MNHDFEDLLYTISPLPDKNFYLKSFNFVGIGD